MVAFPPPGAIVSFEPDGEDIGRVYLFVGTPFLPLTDGIRVADAYAARSGKTLVITFTVSGSRLAPELCAYVKARGILVRVEP